MTSDEDVCKYRNRGMHDRREGMPGKADTRYWHPPRMQYMMPGTIRRLCGCRCGLYRILPDAFAACVTTGYALRYACACPLRCVRLPAEVIFLITRMVSYLTSYSYHISHDSSNNKLHSKSRLTDFGNAVLFITYLLFI